MRLRYLGHAPATFVALGLEVLPGDEFDVDDSVAPGLVGRADIAAAPPKALRRKAKPDDATPTPVSAGDVPDPAVEEVSSGVSDDH